MMKKLMFFIMAVNLFANEFMIFQELNVNNKKFLIQENISKDLNEVITLKDFEYKTKVLVKLSNEHKVMKNITRLLVKIVKVNGFLWDKEISYQDKKYKVLYKFLDKVLSNKQLLLTSTEEALSNTLIKKDVAKKLFTIKNKKSFYIVLLKVIRDYKSDIKQIENISEVKAKIKSNNKLREAFRDINKRINSIEKELQNSI